MNLFTPNSKAKKEPCCECEGLIRRTIIAAFLASVIIVAGVYASLLLLR